MTGPPTEATGGVPLAINRHWYRGKRLPPGAIYCGRGTPLGNPFTVREHGAAALAMYRRWLWDKIRARDARVLAALEQIRPDSLLACSCKPKPCHVDVIVSAWCWLRGVPSPTMKLPRILFLDIDGVLNSLQFMRSRQGRFHSGSFLERVCFHIDGRAIDHLNEITDRTGAKLVLSSTWRNGERWADVLQGIRQMGAKAEFLGRTPPVREHDVTVFERYMGRKPQLFEPYPRGFEIQQWLDAHPDVKSFVILDDDADMAHLQDRLVRTDPVLGLQPSDVERAVDLFETPLEKR